MPTRSNVIGVLLVTVNLLFFGIGICVAGETGDKGGWGKDSAYNKLYDASELDKIRCTVEDVEEVVPMPGMSPGVALKVRESGSDVILVHLCPSWFMDRTSINIKRGDRVKIRGAWAEINGKDIFMASKVKKGDYFELKVRLTKDGTPFWTLSPEALARERASE